MNELQLVIFKLGKEEYGLPIIAVQEINRILTVTKMPQTPDFMEGVINLRGKIIPVVDLRTRFGIGTVVHNDDTRIIVVDVNGKTTGIIVDAVNEVIRLRAADVEPVPTVVAACAEYVEGICKVDDRLIILLDVNRLFNNEEIESLAIHDDAA